MNSPAPANESKQVRSRPIRWLIAVLVVLLVTILVTHWGETHRRLSLWWTGQVTVEDASFYLHPVDRYATELILDTGYYERAETNALLSRIRPGDLFVDVGAHVGWFTVFASKRVGSDGKVIAFEPEPMNFEYLTRNVDTNGCQNVVAHQLAISDRPGKLQLFLHEANKGRHTTVSTGEDQSVVEVKAVTLDDFLRDQEIERLVVKIDVEGAEPNVLQGMQETLNAVDEVVLMIEFAPSRLQSSGEDPKEFLDALCSQGFTILDFDYDGLGDQVTESDSDAVLVRMKKSGVPYLNVLLERSVRVQRNSSVVQKDGTSQLR